MTTYEYVIGLEEFQKLQKIGGCKSYHNEGDAFTHSLLVWKASREIFPNDFLMQKVALLHDVGKIYTGRQKENGDWEYPYHSPKGGEMLHRFIPITDPDFAVIQWYVANHIKPLFWKSLADIKVTTPPRGASIKNLLLLAVCDLMGSYPDEAHRQEEEDTKVRLLMMAREF